MPTLENKSSCWKFYRCLAIISFITLIILFWGIFLLILKNNSAHFIFMLFGILVIIILFLLLLRYIFHVSIFPGSLICVRKMLEESVSKQVAKVYSKRLLSYIDIINSMETTKLMNSADQEIIQEQTEEVGRMIEFLLWDIKELKKNGFLSKNSIYSKIIKFNKLFTTAEILLSTGSYTPLIKLGEYLDKVNTSFSSNKISLSFRK